MYLARQLGSVLRQACEAFPVVALTGARQAGKTTLVRHALGERYAYRSLDAPDVRAFARDDPRGFLEGLGDRAIIDEVQNVPELLSYVKEVVDLVGVERRFVLTGSQHFPLMRGITESLAGRAAVLELAPFTLAERLGRGDQIEGSFRSWLGALSERAEGPGAGPSATELSAPLPLGTWLLEGGYPPVVAEPRRPSALWFPSYVQTYLDRDVRSAIHGSNLPQFEAFLRLVASRTGGVLNQSCLARDVGVSVPTIGEWLSLLEASGVVLRLRPYARNLGKRLTRSPKLFFADTGLAAWLCGLQTEEHLLHGPMGGALFETAVVNDLQRRIRTTMDPASLWFWRTRTGQEVDLVIESAGQPVPIEVKRSATITPGHLRHLRAFLDAAGPDAGPGLVVCTAPGVRRLDERILAVPWWVLAGEGSKETMIVSLDASAPQG